MHQKTKANMQLGVEPNKSCDDRPASELEPAAIVGNIGKVLDTIESLGTSNSIAERLQKTGSGPDQPGTTRRHTRTSTSAREALS
jgi:hypothetical protein